MDDETRILDIKLVSSRYEGMFNVYLSITQLFIEQCPKMLGDIEQAISSANQGDLKISAHTLKGVLGNLYAQSVVPLAQKLEIMARDGDLTEAKPAFKKLEVEVERLVVELKQLLAEQ